MDEGQEKIRDAGRQEDTSSGVIPDTDRKRRLLQCGMILFNNFLLTGAATKFELSLRFPTYWQLS